MKTLLLLWLSDIKWNTFSKQQKIAAIWWAIAFTLLMVAACSNSTAFQMFSIVNTILSLIKLAKENPMPEEE